eukprot:TRINITY_DN68037_c0_g1_i1.p1 TRINITY_DN68037_c0_g1~~TRINITY_DN68037_c0_g1_i1.p1  ORF type:complete len:285 (+),score=28.11 TRINITY_DN68037_c0_g1_i1:44-898(+)
MASLSMMGFSRLAPLPRRTVGSLLASRPATGRLSPHLVQACSMSSGLMSTPPARAFLRLRSRWRLMKLRNPQVGTYGIIGANVTVFGLYSMAPKAESAWQQVWTRTKESSSSWPKSWLPTRDFWDRHFLASYNSVVRHGRFETVPLCTFMHHDFFHMLFNMVTLFFVGRQVEYFVGLQRYLAFYLASGTIAVGAQVASSSGREANVQCLGASGGVYAQLAFLACSFPWQTVYIYMVVPCPLWALASGLVALDMFYMRPDHGRAGHLTGFGCGIAFWALRSRPWR